MTGWTAHLKPGRHPVLVREGWSWPAFAFGPLWLSTQRAWIPAVLHGALLAVAMGVLAGPVRSVAVWTLAVLAGLLGRDLVRWSLERRGYHLVHVVAARDEDAALGRLLSNRPDLAAGMAGLVRPGNAGMQ